MTAAIQNVLGKGVQPPDHGAQESTVHNRLARARVLVVGAGALGAPAALQLARAGVGTLVLIDPDVVEVSNLHRQVLHRTATVGEAKVASAASFLRRRYPAVRVQTHAEPLRVENLPYLFSQVDFVIDATDGVESKFLVNDGAVLSGTPYSHAGILGFVGQTMTVLPRRTACYRCVFPIPPAPDEVPTCQEAGVIGGIAGVIGSIQAGEAIKHLTGEGTPLTDRLLSYDALSRQYRRVPLVRNPHCPVCGIRPAIATLAEAARYGVDL